MFEDVRVIMFELNGIKFYEDGTYNGPRISNAQWKYEDKCLQYKHPNSYDWIRCDNGDNISDVSFNEVFKEQYEKWISQIIEKEIL